MENKVQLMANSRQSAQKIRSKPLLHPEFLEASLQEDDPYWKQALVNASHGEFSSKMTVYSDRRLSRKDSTIAPVRVPKSNPESVARIFVQFHKKHERTLSDNELKAQMSKRQEVCTRQVTLTWTAASPQMKKASLNHYAKETCKLLDFSSELQRGRSIRDLSATLLVALRMKLLDRETVKMSNNIITDVSCVRYDEAYNVWILVVATSKPR